MIIAPIAGMLSDRIGPGPLMVAGLALQAAAIAWLAAILTPDIAYGRLIIPFVLAGAGMALVFAPSANAVLSSVRPQEAGQASGATDAIRELGGVIGVAVLASVFSAHGREAQGRAQHQAPDPRLAARARGALQQRAALDEPDQEGGRQPR
jgi:MFS family permease